MGRPGGGKYSSPPWAAVLAAYMVACSAASRAWASMACMSCCAAAPAAGPSHREELAPLRLARGTACVRGGPQAVALPSGPGPRTTATNTLAAVQPRRRGVRGRGGAGPRADLPAWRSGPPPVAVASEVDPAAVPSASTQALLLERSLSAGEPTGGRPRCAPGQRLGLGLGSQAKLPAAVSQSPCRSVIARRLARVTLASNRAGAPPVC